MVTGASSGIGLCYARELASLGYNIIIVSNRQQENLSAAASIEQDYGVKAIALYKDLSRGEAARELYEQCTALGLEVEVLVNNAGMLVFGTLSNTDVGKIETLTGLHITTPTILTKLFSKDMRMRGHGHILIMSSATAKMAYPTISVYNASKSYLYNFALSIWYELHLCGVGVTVVLPGAVDTPLYDLSDSKRKLLRHLGIMISPERLAHKAVKKMFAGRRKYIPGAFTKTVVVAVSFIPTWVITAIMTHTRLRRLFQ